MNNHLCINCESRLQDIGVPESWYCVSCASDALITKLLLKISQTHQGVAVVTVCYTVYRFPHFSNISVVLWTYGLFSQTIAHYALRAELFNICHVYCDSTTVAVGVDGPFLWEIVLILRIMS